MLPLIRRARGLALALASVMVLGAPASGQPTGEGTIRIGAALDDQTTPLLYAQHAGLFQKAGLTVDLQKFSSGTIIAAAVAGGALEIGKASMSAIVVAHAKGLPFTLIAPIASYRSDNPDCGLLVGAKSSVKSAKDLNGKTLAVSALGDLYAVTTSAWIDANGGDVQSVKFVELAPPAVPAAIDQGRVEGGMLCEPVLESAVSSGKYRIAAPVFDAVAKRWQVAALFAKDDWIAQHRETVEKFVRVMYEASAYIAGHESESGPLIAPFVGLEPATVAHMRHPGRTLYLDAGETQPLIDLLAKYKSIPRSFPAQELISPLALKPPGR